MKKDRTLRLNKNFILCKVYENEEIYPNGIFVFNISRIIEHIDSGLLIAELEEIIVAEWYGKSFTKNIINEDHLKTHKLKAELLIPYFIDVKSYQAFVGYWNDKLTD